MAMMFEYAFDGTGYIEDPVDEQPEHEQDQDDECTGDPVSLQDDDGE